MDSRGAQRRRGADFKFGISDVRFSLLGGNSGSEDGIKINSPSATGQDFFSASLRLCARTLFFPLYRVHEGGFDSVEDHGTTDDGDDCE
ncbi:hypothetical protein HN588_12630, partial [Candidatus Bathyarchaeota archaeon]|nr:hypothetical protein [Candidatus Bathyarchaeota archaeon]